MKRPRFLPDNMTLMLLTVVLIASVFPARGTLALRFDDLSTGMIGLLFFMHGAKLSREAVLAGATHWRLHLLVLAVTFALFPLLGLLLKPALLPLVTPDLYLGILFLCVLPSTVQSSIAFTSVARGNVPAAVCSASASNLLGIVLTPLLVSVVIKASGDSNSSLDAMLKIVYQLLLPFVAGQLARPYLQAWITRHIVVLKMVDQSSILLVVFVAFSAAVVQGLWQQIPTTMLLSLLLISSVLLAVIMGVTVLLSRRLGFSKEDEITIVFCASKKSLASGVPMAKVLFSSASVGMVLLPLMLFHQLQLMVCAVLAQRYATRNDKEA
ncbi:MULTISPECIES: bile acid:sodium symporter family protein [unclassified Undibacterium]|uniref:bile acid:sodium symporter family protein n=1 Tax=unclassified Undibacterium TaxID=2630295 RepID=UPI002AC93CED|nr:MULTISPECIES: bile acid:sodium symporter family protein [unclassified Undibacterium]MEB0140126.1 bile acid:sodium symporter family protein [Undibacterium sp. CCC2.1]MEB0173606.1 bile acid:sodium symporter family protein [Undibacterium sp. CCC1.1]MEB0177537.1 bile acid:sodium symporter family protein [Undibacterium sp. CCC3.4]MEB0214459.1 bile acid:sodium symporter family protein [Undibacterium sp. 5I2]WPX42856.1 bile acid:sodium symporter family protein [Undibacterium sp. CCC3.4]